MRLKVLIAVFLLIKGISISFGQSDSLLVKTDSLSYILNYSKDESFMKSILLHVENSLRLRIFFEGIVAMSKDSLYGILPDIEIIRQTGKAGKCSIDGGLTIPIHYFDKKDFLLGAGVASTCFPSLGVYQVRIVLNWRIFESWNYQKSYSNWFTLKLVSK